MRTLILGFALAVVPLWGCASGRSSGSDSTSSDRNAITREELASMRSSTAYQAVERFHREWFRGRAGTLRTDSGRNFAYVFVDGQRYGALESLYQFGTEDVEEIRFISPSDATTRYGTGFVGGIIHVFLRKDISD